MILSECCNALTRGSSVDPICSVCGEHCDVYDDECVIGELPFEVYYDKNNLPQRTS